MTTIDLTAAHGTNYKIVTKDHFGGNFLFHTYSVDSNSSADFSIRNLGITSLRYPGGGTTEERFDVKNPDKKTLDDGSTATTLTEIFEYAGNNNLSLKIVIPMDTFKYPGSGAVSGREYNKQHLENFIDKSMALAKSNNVAIQSFELGNEYWGRDDRAPTQRSEDYGLQAAHAAKIIRDHLTESHHNSTFDPKILVQQGSFVPGQAVPGGPQLWADLSASDSNNIIISKFSQVSGSFSSIDGLVMHRYQNGEMESFDPLIGHGLRGQWVNHLNDAGLDGNSIMMNWTEWNSHHQNSSLEYGLRQGSNILNMFSSGLSLRDGGNPYLSSMDIWPIFGNNDLNALSYNSAGRTVITAGGKTFQMMSEELVGLKPVDISNQNENILISSFFDEDKKLVVFVSSRSDATQVVDISLGGLTSGYHHVWGKSLDVVGEGPVNIKETPTKLTVLNSEDLFKDGDPNIDLNLNPYQVTRLVFSFGNNGVNILGDKTDAYNDKLVGSGFGDVMNGYGGNDRLEGLAGNDRLTGGAGNDTILGGSGNDTLNGNSGNDRLNGGPGADLMKGGAGNDIYFIESSGDTIVESLAGGTDLINASISIDLNSNSGAYSNVENITLTGANNIDASGSADDNILIGNGGNNTLLGRLGNDTLDGGIGQDRLEGGSGHDVLNGGSNADTLLGGNGHDSLNGGAGPDRIDGGSGNDTLNGGGGADNFIFRKGYGSDIITDFSNDVDVIDLRGFGISNFNQALNYATQIGGRVEFDFGDGDVLTIRNITINDLSDDMTFG